MWPRQKPEQVEAKLAPLRRAQCFVQDESAASLSPMIRVSLETGMVKHAASRGKTK